LAFLILHAGSYLKNNESQKKGWEHDSSRVDHLPSTCKILQNEREREGEREPFQKKKGKQTNKVLNQL
jgi:hypothetical protein